MRSVRSSRMLGSAIGWVLVGVSVRWGGSRWKRWRGPTKRSTTRLRGKMPPDLSSADVTVMVCAYNAEETLGATLASIAAQTERPGSVVVVDDASTDGT